MLTGSFRKGVAHRPSFSCQHRRQPTHLSQQGAYHFPNGTAALQRAGGARHWAAGQVYILTCELCPPSKARQSTGSRGEGLGSCRRPTVSPPHPPTMLPIARHFAGTHDWRKFEDEDDTGRGALGKPQKE